MVHNDNGRSGVYDPRTLEGVKRCLSFVCFCFISAALARSVCFNMLYVTVRVLLEQVQAREYIQNINIFLKR